MAAEKENERLSAYKSIQVEAVGRDEYRSLGLWEAGGKLRSGYGGQIIGQSLMAACHTVDDIDLLLLSAHCYFLSPVNFTDPVTYRVARTKDGRSFSLRSVEVLQGDRTVSKTLASFKKPENNSYTLSHSTGGIPPGVFPPGDDRTGNREMFNELKYPSSPLDSYYYFTESDQVKLLAREPIAPRMMMWLKCHGDFPESCHQNVHRVALALLSDFSLTAPLRFKYPEFKGLVTSLDHSIWFNVPVHCHGSWFFQVASCLQAGDGTSLNSSFIYSETGALVATCQQQALYRLKSML